MTPHSDAVEAAIMLAGDRLTATDEPLLELARALARQMDASGPDGPGTRLAGTYLTTIRTLTARLGTIPVVTHVGKLADLRANRPRKRLA